MLDYHPLLFLGTKEKVVAYFVGVQLEGSRDFAFVHIEGTLGEESHTLLWGRGLVFGQVVEVGRFLDYFIVSASQ
jgi:hypothetical protein